MITKCYKHDYVSWHTHKTYQFQHRDATIIDFVATNIVWVIITVSLLLCIYSFHNIKLHKQSLDIKVLFITAFWNINNTVTINTAQNNNTKEKKRPSLLLELKKVTFAL